MWLHRSNCSEPPRHISAWFLGAFLAGVRTYGGKLVVEEWCFRRYGTHLVPNTSDKFINMQSYLFKLLAIAVAVLPATVLSMPVEGAAEGEVGENGIICPQAITPAAERPAVSQRRRDSSGSRLFAPRACNTDVFACEEDEDCFEFGCTFCALHHTPCGDEYTRCR
ncbi:hypothetical protein B0T20DRAFT_396717 [Sordaria brevicollis]|uniref:Uncharacterized protein n=1 Tax=Sordaria brevicollis TaxID=83679 RepID=A0AAE0U675_SORBR|nr:hypothetical protein B0T20DRAFT_396717 [Sordaria brevicollis]